VPSAIHHAAEQLGSTGNFENAAGGLHLLAFRDVFVVAEHHGADRIPLQVQREAEGVADELEHFTVARVRETMDADDASVTLVTVPTLRASLVGLEFLDARLDQVADFRLP